MQKTAVNAMNLALRCTATSKRTKKPCQAPAVRGKRVCRFHGAFAGAPRGKAHGNYKHGRFTCEAIKSRQMVAALIALANKGLLALP